MSGTVWQDLDNGVWLGFTRPNGTSGRRFLLRQPDHETLVVEVGEGRHATDVLWNFLAEHFPRYLKRIVDFQGAYTDPQVEVALVAGRLIGAYDLQHPPTSGLASLHYEEHEHAE